MKIIVTEQIADKGIACLRESAEVDLRYGIEREELLACIGEYDGLIVRSVTRVDEELLQQAVRLKAVGRAGNGIDNIDVDSATRHGVIVVNCPEGNSIAAAEHTVGMLLAVCRNIPQATAFLKAGNWGRKQFEGVELHNKTVGIIGLGRIGGLVATRLRGFGMKIMAYDPYITRERFERFAAERAEHLEELLRAADFITVHTPRTEETIGMIGAAELAMVKPTVRLVNCARGGIYDEQALYEALESGRIAGAALDVFVCEPSYGNPLFRLPNVVVTAHMGASTIEAQDNIGMSIAEQVITAIRGELVPNAVNLPTLRTQDLKAIQPYIDLAEKFGKLYYQLRQDPAREVEVICTGELAGSETKMITIAFLKGLLETVLKERVNYVNSPYLAEARGIRVRESWGKEAGEYPTLLRVRVAGEKDEMVLAGTVFGREEPKLLEIYGYKVDVVPSRYMLFIENMDQPGMIGVVGTILGQQQVNIATMQVGRRHVGSRALMILNVDNAVGAAELDKIRRVNGIIGAKFTRL